jgi:hypothetical protein
LKSKPTANRPIAQNPLKEIVVENYYPAHPTTFAPPATAKRILVTGITTGFQPQSPVYTLPQRTEWHQFVKDMDNVTLYVQALHSLMTLDQSEALSFFQIGGSSLHFLI